MTIAREEIFGPVLVDPSRTTTRKRRSAIANDTPYGLSGYVHVGRPRARAPRSPRGCAPATCTSTAPAPTSPRPFGGYKQSGNGREWGEYGFEEFLEVKAIMGAAA